MTDQQRQFWHLNRIIGPILFFAVIAFVLHNYAGMAPLIAIAIAGAAAFADFLVLTWLMKRLESNGE